MDRYINIQLIDLPYMSKVIMVKVYAVFSPKEICEHSYMEK